MALLIVEGVSIRFDPKVILSKARKAKEKTLKRAGAITQGIMRRKFVYRKRGTSKPGNPPFVHQKQGGLKQLVFFQYLPESETVVVGPTLTLTKTNISPLPGILDRGGPSLTTVGRGKNKRRAIVQIRPRPFTKSSLEDFQSQYADLWKDSIR